MHEIEFTLNTVEIAKMLDNTPHKDILKKLEGRTGKNGRHIKGYLEILTERQMSPSDFFIPSKYKDSSGKENKCYKVTKKGCEFLANKFTGEKGVIFTARYINRFHEMEEEIRSMPAAGRRRVTFLQEIKAAERVANGMSQGQKLELYKSIYERHGLRFNIEPEMQIEDRKVSCHEGYREKSINMVDRMGNEDYLFKIYHYILAKYRRDKGYERKQ